MKYEVGDKVKIKENLILGQNYGGFDLVDLMAEQRGQIVTITKITREGNYEVDDNHYFWSEEMLEPAVPTLAEIKEKKFSCVVHTKTKNEAKMLIELLGINRNYIYDPTDTCIDFWEQNKENTCYRIFDGKIREASNCQKYADKGETIYEFSDLFATGGAVSCKALFNDLSQALKETSNTKEKKDIQIEFANGSSIKSLPPQTDAIRSKRANILIGIEKEEKKMPTKFTFYVTEGTRVDKSCNGTIPTMTTNIELLSGNVFDKVTTVKGSATCDKADYDERQGVLEALANAVCGGEFEKRYKKAVKVNKDADLWMRTCYYCGKVFDTVEEKVAHDDWHVERKKARHERYLLRKRAKEIAFEEAAQKLAKEMMGEQK